MRAKWTLLVVALTAVSSIAMAEDNAPPAGAMAAPKPAPENDAYKKWVGTFSCEGTGKGPDGKEMKYKTSWGWKSVLGGHWYTIVYKRPKAGPMPAFEGNATIGYDTANKRFLFSGVDNMGGWINLTATDGLAYAGEGVPRGQKGPIKISFVKGKDKKGQESDKMFDVTLDFGGGQVVTESCKK